MKIYGIHGKKVMACAGSWAFVVEAGVDLPDGSDVYVTVQDYDGLEMTVSKESLYGFLVCDGEEPAGFLEEYTAWKDAKASEYAPVFEKLKKVLKMLEEN